MGNDMNRNEAAAALADVNRTENKLAERAHWPFHRHAMFGLMEGLLVAGIAQPIAMMGATIAVAMALLVVCVTEDRRRNGMFISGLQGRSTRWVVAALLVFLLPMMVASAALRDGESVQPLGYALGAIVFAVCTAGSLLWQKVYRAELAEGDGR
jgi:cobalamin synthase